MAPSTNTQRDPTASNSQQSTPWLNHRERRIRAYNIRKRLDPQLATRATRTSKKGRQRAKAWRASQQHPNSITTTTDTPNESICHDSDHLGKTVPELRLTMKHAGLDSQPRSRHRNQTGSDEGQYQEEAFASSFMEVDETAEEVTGWLKRDWKKDDEESERPCYWSLLEKLNWELRITGN
ncbi:hypothetical protein VM1G_07548 [Cytospora mali]|uniref:Uncharacterized protein n=1 Tax=Cytospora mali TaxID=578113 RepID=A0A194W889_CYTMA|nr:hypothetical protein VM1G_07548 [Valsa mali]